MYQQHQPQKHKQPQEQQRTLYLGWDCITIIFTFVKDNHTLYSLRLLCHRVRTQVDTNLLAPHARYYRLPLNYYSILKFFCLPMSLPPCEVSLDFNQHCKRTRSTNKHRIYGLLYKLPETVHSMTISGTFRGCLKFAAHLHTLRLVKCTLYGHDWMQKVFNVCSCLHTLQLRSVAIELSVLQTFSFVSPSLQTLCVCNSDNFFVMRSKIDLPRLSHVEFRRNVVERNFFLSLSGNYYQPTRLPSLQSLSIDTLSYCWSSCQLEKWMPYLPLKSLTVYHAAANDARDFQHFPKTLKVVRYAESTFLDFQVEELRKMLPAHIELVPVNPQPL